MMTEPTDILREYTRVASMTEVANAGYKALTATRHEIVDTDAMAAEIARLREEVADLSPDEYTVMVRVSRDLLPTMGEWCQAVRVMVQHESDGVARLVFNDQPAQEIATLSGVVDSVRKLERFDVCAWTEDECAVYEFQADKTGAVVMWSDLTRAIGDTP